MEASDRDIIVQTVGGELINIKDYAGYYDPLQYPLLLPYGTYGWYSNYESIRGRRITCCDYYAYMLQIRGITLSIILHGGRLLQQYVVDNYVKIEAQKLRWIRFHQNDIRAELYEGLQDCLNAGENNAGNVGRRIILPSSFTGSPRDMYQRYQDAMAIVQKFAKYEELKEDIFHKGVLGKTIAHVHVIEFQKRGLPHVHMLVIFDEDDKLNTPEDYDCVVRAEIPDKNEEPELYAAVLKHMIHGPCGQNNSNAPCMQNMSCKKGYPKPFAECTVQGNDSYPIYRRRNDHRSVALDNEGEVVVDNGWVVPYNPWLLLKYDCHINVEICSSIKSIKYVYKYVYKGPDCIVFEVRPGPVYDEISQYVDGRWICAPEALWRIFKFSMSRIYPSVMASLRKKMAKEEHNPKGPKSFDDLLTVDGVHYLTFKQAAEKHGLLEDDNSIRDCLVEARSFRMPSALRRLFATILLYCEPSGVRMLWEENYPHMIEDYPSSSNVNSLYIMNKLLHDINDILQQHKRSIKEFDLPQISEGFEDMRAISDLIEHELSIPISDDDLYGSRVLNVELERLFSIGHYLQISEMMDASFWQLQHPVSLRTYFLVEGLRILSSKYLSSLSQWQCAIFSKQSDLCALIIRASAIIWDEAPMANRKAFETVDRTFRDMLGVDLPFGGKVMILGGDFRQVLPVVINGTKSQIIKASIVESSLWSSVKVLNLSENMRAQHDPHFSDFLLRVGNGDEPTIENDMIRIPDSMAMHWEGENSIDELINAIFPDLSSHMYDTDYMENRAIITPLNDDVNKLNEKAINAFPGEEVTYYSFDSVPDDTCNLYLPEFLKFHFTRKSSTS
ncbi:UNVERIFIED_CONTAM: hypothetical protein Sangu_3021300 [Sesamum angustifolium]|uniref:ATP-dependent DNA helicase n=1 Tax=Sesamum angustifolium TaxID=2727405 RepID=A0AAW2KL56_9LAMI